MAIGKNYKLDASRNHFKKHWQRRVRVHLDQAGKKNSRRDARIAKAAVIAPKPVDLLRPIVRCPTLRYNRKVRAGRGFTLEELKAAELNPRYARTVGIAVDARRHNKSVEAFEANVARLQSYKEKLVVFGKEAPTGEQVTVAAAFPIEQPSAEEAPRAVVVPEVTAFKTIAEARAIKKNEGIRAKRAADKAAAEAEKKK